MRPLATLQTPGAFLGGLRIMAVDRTVFDVPDTLAFARVFGYPATRPGTQAAGEEQTIMYKWFNKVGYEANIPALREEYPGLTTFK